MSKPIHVTLLSTDQPCEQCETQDGTYQYTFPLTLASGLICADCMQETLNNLNAYIPGFENPTK